MLFLLALCAIANERVTRGQEAPLERARSRPAVAEKIGRGELDVKGAGEKVRLFCRQGMAWLHGGDLRQADRSFFEAASLEPGCAMAWCGLALANEADVKTASRYARRARELATEASSRERMWADALVGFFDEATQPHDRRMFFTEALDRLVTSFPDDVEARAVLARQMIENRGAGGMVTLTAPAAAMLDELLREHPQHPAQRYRVQLWLRAHPERGLESADMIRQEMRAVPQALSDAGRLFSALGRLEEAVSCFEASATAAVSQVEEEKLMPQEVSGWVENTRLLLQHLGRCGRLHEALGLARGLIELAVPTELKPVIAKGTSHAMAAGTEAESVTVTGQRELLGLLIEHHRWVELEEAVSAGYLESDELEIQARLCHARGLAARAKGDQVAFEKLREDLRSLSQRAPFGSTIPARTAYRQLTTALLAELEQGVPEASPAKANPNHKAETFVDNLFQAPELSLPDGKGNLVSLSTLRGRPVVVVFYLGAGCPHCIQQLRSFAPLDESYREAGITILAVSTDSVAGLKDTLAYTDAGKAVPFQLLSDAPMRFFREFGAYDVHRDKPLHGIFLIDEAGRVRWRVTGTEPFMETDSLLKEARRVLRFNHK
jgi:peroxiredoxin/tetratricopeptide (TPR) repeat protein